MFWYIGHSFRFSLIGLCRSYFYLSFCCYGYCTFFLVMSVVVFYLDGYLFRWSKRSSPPETFCKKGVFKNYTKFKEKRLSQSLFLNKAAGLRPATSLNKRIWHRCFPGNFVKFLRTCFS